MTVFNLSMMALQVQALTEEGKAESEAVQQVLKEHGINQEQAQQMNVEQEILKLVNRDTQQEAQEAEQQLQQQASGYQPQILKDPEVQPETEATLQEEQPDQP